MTEQTINTQASEHDVLMGFYQTIHTALHNLEYEVGNQPNNIEGHLKAMGQLIDLCEQRPQNKLFEYNTTATQELCTRMAALYQHLLLDQSSNLSFKSIVMLTLQKRFIHQVFEISGFGSEHALQQVLLRKAKTQNSKTFTKNMAAVKHLLLSTTSTLDAEQLVQLSLEDSETAAVLAIGLLLDRMPTNLAGEAGRQFLLEQFNPYAQLQPLDPYRALVANVWMLCSYSTSPAKHDIKKHLNGWYKRMHKAKGLQVRPTGSVTHPGNTENKPVMAVVAESFSSVHAMYRWYAPIVKELKKDYFLVLVALRNDVDDTAVALFDEFLEVPAKDELNVQTILNQCTPDIAYFTSVGMRSWGICMANLRWAPLQMMSFGHPATSHSSEMDLAFISTRTVSSQGVVAENMLVLESEIGSLIEVHKQLRLPVPMRK